jgi:hypothetical protein
MTNRYKLQEGPDHIVWVSIQPLMEDIREKLDFYLSVPAENLLADDIDKIDFTILSMRAVYAFLGSLLTEHTLVKMKAEE